MSESPLRRLLEAVDRLDVDGAISLLAPECRLLAADGRRAEGTHAVRELLSDVLSSVRSTTHRTTAEWHQDNAWIAEIEATYELTDATRTGVVPRALVLRDGPQGVAEVHVYGAHEHRLDEHRAAEGQILIGGRWLPPL